MQTYEVERISKARMLHLSTILWKKLFLSTFVLANLFFNDLLSKVSKRVAILLTIKIQKLRNVHIHIEGLKQKSD